MALDKVDKCLKVGEPALMRERKERYARSDPCQRRKVFGAGVRFRRHDAARVPRHFEKRLAFIHRTDGRMDSLPQHIDAA